MQLKINKRGVVKEQDIQISEGLIGIYGYNNCGKTTVLKQIDNVVSINCLKSIVEYGNSLMSLFIPTNRIVVKSVYINDKVINDLEDFVSYKKEIYEEYDLHLRYIRNLLLENVYIRDYIGLVVNSMFDIEKWDMDKRESDGVENIINIYCNIIWLLTWNYNIKTITKEELENIFNNNQGVILIDEIEAFLHVRVQSRLLQRIKKDFPKCTIIFTTHSPLLLSRTPNIKKYNLKDGILNEVFEDLYYKDLNVIYEGYFDVQELPDEAAGIINKLGEYIMGEKIDENELSCMIELLNSKYINIKNRYMSLIGRVECKMRG